MGLFNIFIGGRRIVFAKTIFYQMLMQGELFTRTEFSCLQEFTRIRP